MSQGWGIGVGIDVLNFVNQKDSAKQKQMYRSVYSYYQSMIDEYDEQFEEKNHFNFNIGHGCLGYASDLNLSYVFSSGYDINIAVQYSNVVDSVCNHLIGGCDEQTDIGLAMNGIGIFLGLGRYMPVSHNNDHNSINLNINGALGYMYAMPIDLGMLLRGTYFNHSEYYNVAIAGHFWAAKLKAGIDKIVDNGLVFGVNAGVMVMGGIDWGAEEPNNILRENFFFLYSTHWPHGELALLPVMIYVPFLETKIGYFFNN